jgi:hypothetical protein
MDAPDDKPKPRSATDVLFWLALPERTNEEREQVYRALRRGTKFEQPGDV